MSKLTDEKIADLREQISKGPWGNEESRHPGSHDAFYVNIIHDADGSSVAHCESRIASTQDANAEAIALVPDLLAEVERLRQEIAYRDMLDV